MTQRRKDIFNIGEMSSWSHPDIQKRKMSWRELSKKRITVFLVCNIDESQKLKPLIIWKSAKPRCLKIIKSLPTTYRSWVTTWLFNEWLTSVNSGTKQEKRKILLDCTVHDNLLPLNHVKLIFTQHDIKIATIRP